MGSFGIFRELAIFGFFDLSKILPVLIFAVGQFPDQSKEKEKKKRKKRTSTTITVKSKDIRGMFGIKRPAGHAHVAGTKQQSIDTIVID